MEIFSSNFATFRQPYTAASNYTVRRRTFAPIFSALGTASNGLWTSIFGFKRRSLTGECNQIDRPRTQIIWDLLSAFLPQHLGSYLYKKYGGCHLKEEIFQSCWELATRCEFGSCTVQRQRYTCIL